MVIRQSISITPLAGGSASELGFWPTLFGGIMAALAARTAIHIGIEEVKLLWKIVRTETLAVDQATATDELVQIQGCVQPTQPDDTFTSPILDNECVVYEYRVDRYGLRIRKSLQNTGSEPVESGSAYTSFVLSDGNGDIVIDPNADSLVLQTTTETLSTKAEQTADERVEFEPTAYRLALGESTQPVDLTERTINVGERVTIIGRTTTVADQTTTGGDAVITPEESGLTVMDDDPRNVAKTKARRGVFALICAPVFSFFAVFMLQDAIFTIL